MYVLKWYNVMILLGDGIGLEIMCVARSAFEAAGARADVAFAFEEGFVGGSVIDVYGMLLLEEMLEMCKVSDVVLLVVIGGYKWDNLSSAERSE